MVQSKRQKILGDPAASNPATARSKKIKHSKISLFLYRTKIILNIND